MPGGSNRGPLADHLTIGRGDFSGPMIGGDVVFGGHVIALASATEILNLGWIAPFEMRLQAVTLFVRDITVGGSTLLTYALYKHPTLFQVAGATSCFSAAATETVNSTGRVIGATTADCIGTTTVTLANAARDIARGDRVFFGMSTNAGTVSDISVYLVATCLGYATQNSVED